MTPFTLGRMRHLDLLALWHRLNPDAHQKHQDLLHSITHDALAALILSSP
jgi:hypothetical protein